MVSSREAADDSCHPFTKTEIKDRIVRFSSLCRVPLCVDRHSFLIIFSTKLNKNDEEKSLFDNVLFWGRNEQSCDFFHGFVIDFFVHAESTFHVFPVDFVVFWGDVHVLEDGYKVSSCVALRTSKHLWNKVRKNSMQTRNITYVFNVEGIDSLVFESILVELCHKSLDSFSSSYPFIERWHWSLNK